MLRQIINGSVKQTVMVSGTSSDLAALAAVCAGRCEIWDKKADGGSMTFKVAVPNAIGFSVGKKYIDGSRASAFVRLPHLKATKTIQDVKTEVLGNWDSDYTVAEACEYVNEIGNSSRG